MHPLKLEEIEGLSKEKILIKIGATEKQIELMDRAISQAPEQKGQMNPAIYDAMIEGYKSIRRDLETDLKNYNEVLKKK